MGIGKVSSHWKADGTAFYEPSAGAGIMHTSISSADSGRTEDGVMHNTWVRRNIVKIDLRWKALTGSEVQTLMNQLQGREFTLTYYEFGAEHTADVYVSEFNYTNQGSGLYATEGGLCTDISVKLIEK